RAPDHHVEDLRLLVEVAHDQARGERGRVPADVTGSQAVLLRGREVDLDGHRRLLRDRAHHGIRHAGHPGEYGLYAAGLLLEHVQVGAVDADDEVLALFGRHLADAVAGVGDQVGPQARVAVHHGGDRRLGPGVVGLVVERDPDLGRVDVGELVRTDGPPD